MKDKKVIMEASNPTVLIINGKKYIYEKQTLKKIDKVEHADKIIFKEFDEEDYKDCLDVVIGAIEDKVAKKELIRELVKSIDYKTLRRLARRIESGKLIKKQKGCLGFKIGDAYLHLID